MDFGGLVEHIEHNTNAWKFVLEIYFLGGNHYHDSELSLFLWSFAVLAACGNDCNMIIISKF